MHIDTATAPVAPEPEYPELWRPDRAPDQVNPLLGEFTSWEPNGPDFGYGPSQIATIRDRAGKEWSVFMFHDVLRRRFAAVRPEYGELVQISYLGKKAGDRGYHRYRVNAPDREPAAVDWVALAGDLGDLSRDAALAPDEPSAALNRPDRAAELAAPDDDLDLPF